jgi:hypothetical protein
VRRDEVEQADGDTKKIQALYELVTQRTPERSEVQVAEEFLASQPETGTSLSPLEKYAQVLLLSNELMFVD